MKTVHKYKRSLKNGDQYIVCTNKKCNFSESVAYRWAKVKCKACLKLKPSK